jgi:serine O-acetyltransferase
MYKFLKLITGIQMPLMTTAGGGLRFFHHDCIIIAGSVKIGRNVSIHQGVTIGRVFAGNKAGVPTIGNNVVIFAGAKILGNIQIGDNAVIGANAVVTKDIPAYAIAAGVPARVISDDSRHCFSGDWLNTFHQHE